MPEIVFFYSSDQEILELSDYKEHPSFIIDSLDVDLKLLVLLLPLDGCIIFPPSQFLESVPCRILLLRNLLFIYEGYIKLFIREPTLVAHLEKEREQYKFLSNINRYKHAYYSGTDYNIRNFPFRIEPKGFHTGEATMATWEQMVRHAANSIGYPKDRIRDLIKRVRDNETIPFVWELVEAVLSLTDITERDERLLGIRTAIGYSYLNAHLSSNIALPNSSLVVRDSLIPRKSKNNCYDLVRFKRLLQAVGIFKQVIDFEDKKILELKFKISHIMNQVRKLLDSGFTSEVIYSDLKKKGLVNELEQLVKEISSGGSQFQSGIKTPFLADAKPNVFFDWIDRTKMDWVKIAAVQLEYELEQHWPYKVNKQEKEIVRNKILKALVIAEKESTNIVSFPELCFDRELLGEVQDKCKNMIIICGSYYDGGYNVCPIIRDERIYYYKKVHPSPFERSAIKGQGMKSGDELFVIQTKFGRISILLCIDYTAYCHKIYGYKPDIVINPCYDEKILRFQKRADVDVADYEYFIVQTNRAKYGGTCIIGLEHKSILKQLINEKYKPNDEITYKLCQAEGEMIVIADVNIACKAPSIPTPVNYEGRIKNILKYPL